MNLNNTAQVKERWEIEINSNISNYMWEEICTEVHLVTNSNAWREFKWKVVIRFFRTITELQNSELQLNLALQYTLK